MDHATSLAKNRSGVWEIRWREDGRSKSLSARTTDRRIAEAVKRTFDRTEAAAVVGTRSGAGGETVEALVDAYMVAAAKRGVTAAQGWSLKPIRAFFGAMTPDEITLGELEDYGESRHVADATVRRELVALRAALNWAVRNRRLGVCPVIELPAHGKARAVYLDEENERALFALAAGDANAGGRLSRIGLFICLGLDTGARRSAMLGLTWDRVDFAHGTVDFRDPLLRTTKKRRVATPITDRLRPVLTRYWGESGVGSSGAGTLVFGAGDVRAAWDAFMDRHAFDGMTAHVMRHTRITLLLRAGVPVWDVSALVGASADMITEVYGHHVVDDRLRAQANKRAA